MRLIHKIIYDWGVRCFGPVHMGDKRLRAMRLLEEANELAQSVGVEKTTAHDIVRMVYARPPGEVQQEIGGVLMTASAMCSSVGLDFDETMDREVLRCLSKSPEHFARRNEEKLRILV